jgi:hypothetical protein
MLVPCPRHTKKYMVSKLRMRYGRWRRPAVKMAPWEAMGPTHYILKNIENSDWVWTLCPSMEDFVWLIAEMGRRRK